MKLVVKPIPTPSGASHPPPPNPILPEHEFSMGFIAPKGSGKTTALMNLMYFYKNYFHSIIVFSPTVNNDEKWEWIKKQPLLAENKPLKEFIQLLKDQEPEGLVKRPPPQGLDQYVTEFSPMIPESHFIAQYDEHVLAKIMHEQQKLINLLKKFGMTKHIANRVLIIFDDLVGSSLFSGKKQNPFKMLNTNHRHYSTSLLMVTQAYKEIPKTVRTQFSCLIIFEIPNENEVKVIYEENPMNLKYNEWLEVYHEATSGDHNFLFINYQQKDKKMRMMQNFSRYLFFSK